MQDNYGYNYGYPYYSGQIGSYDDVETPRKHTIIQSLWTKPIKDKERLKKTLHIAALSLAYAHQSGYRVNMHTDSKGMELLKGFGYDELKRTLDKIPDTVPTELFAAGKFFAMKEEGMINKVHIDIDVFLKKKGVLDRFYDNRRIDVICQQEEDVCSSDHEDKIKHMYILGYPTSTRPDWVGSCNTGVIGFNNFQLAKKYFDNYYEALTMYTQKKFDSYKKEHENACLLFDFILEQKTLSYLSVGYDILTLVPTKYPTFVADEIGYQHLQGSMKWSGNDQYIIQQLLRKINPVLLSRVNAACRRV